MKSGVVGMRTYAPPEQSEPAITSSRPWTMLAGRRRGSGECAWDERQHFDRLDLGVNARFYGARLSHGGCGAKVGRGGQDRNLESASLRVCETDHHVIAPSRCVEPCAR